MYFFQVKVWNTRNGFCFVTFKDHTAGVKAVKFTSNGQVIISASLDGTVRAFDMNRSVTYSGTPYNLKLNLSYYYMRNY